MSERLAATGPVVVLGGGIDALVATALLARSGVLVALWTPDEGIGGELTSDEFHPGFRAAPLPLSLGPLRASVTASLAGLDVPWIEVEPRLVSLAAGEQPLVLSGSPSQAAEAVWKLSARDAVRYAELNALLERLARRAARLIDTPPVDLGGSELRPLLRLLPAGLSLARLGRRTGRDLARWAPMPVADFASEWFETERLRAVVASRALLGSLAGPMSPGTTAALLLRAVCEGGGVAGATRFVRGGGTLLAEALAALARRAGATLRTSCRASGLEVRGGRVVAVVSEAGETVAARAVLSCLGVRRTGLELLPPEALDPEERHRLSGFRTPGVVARVDLALDGLPRFRGVEDEAALRGRLLLAETLEVLERAHDAAKHAELPRTPWVEAVVPTLSDPSLAPPGQHVLSAWVQTVPGSLAQGTWPERRDALGDVTMQRLEAVAPGLGQRVVARRVLPPPDVEATWGVEGGHPWQGELSLNQLFAFRPLIGWASYRTPVPGLYLAGGATHPGAGTTGASGANAARVLLADLGRG